MWETAVRRHLYVFCYDISNDRRRRRVARVLEEIGLRVQESVFECWLGAGEESRRAKELLRLIDPRDDLLTWYRLTHDEAAAARVLGCGGVPQEPGCIVL